MSNRIAVSLRPVSDSTSEAAIRQHRVLIDRPVEKGGEDGGPMGGELFLASVGGCFMSNILALIRSRGLADGDEVRTEVTGTLDGTPARFTAIELTVQIGLQDREQAAKLVEMADRACIMTNTLRDKLDFSVRLI